MTLLNSIGWSVLAFLFVLGVMIFIHELGHYLMAKLLGIRVEVFSLGFGRRLVGFKKGPTDYRISLLPLGGYVKMAGENYDEELRGTADEFLSRPKPHRFAVAIAGPAMNLGLALILLAAVYMVGVPVAKYSRQPALIGAVEEGSPAEQAGLQPGDVIVEIDGDPTPTWRDAELKILAGPNQELVLTLKRDEQVLEREITTSVAEPLEVGTIGIFPADPYVISEVEAGSPAAQAGLQTGDEVIKVSEGDRVTYGFTGSARMISSSEGEPLLFQISRGEDVFEKAIAPVQMDGRWRIGTLRQEIVELETYGLWGAVQKSVERNYELTVLTLEIVGRIITGKMSLKAMSGPIEIARFSGVAASLGVVYLMNFMALVSLQLGILNLMPIPILDGGVIALLAVEGLIRRDLSMRVKERIFQVGFLFLILLMGIVIFNDIAKNLPILD